MIIQCSHWSDCEGVGGCCDAGEFKGKPLRTSCLTHCTIYAGPPATEQMLKIAKGLDDAERAEARKDGCAGCSKAKKVSIVRWMGVLWFGKPKPLRLRLQWPWRFEAGPGCGCMVWAKTMVLAFKTSHRNWYQMWSQARNAYKAPREAEDALEPTKPVEAPEPSEALEVAIPQRS